MVIPQLRVLSTTVLPLITLSWVGPSSSDTRMPPELFWTVLPCTRESADPREVDPFAAVGHEVFQRAVQVGALATNAQVVVFDDVALDRHVRDVRGEDPLTGRVRDREAHDRDAVEGDAHRNVERARVDHRVAVAAERDRLRDRDVLLIGARAHDDGVAVARALQCRADRPVARLGARRSAGARRAGRTRRHVHRLRARDEEAAPAAVGARRNGPKYETGRDLLASGSDHQR